MRLQTGSAPFATALQARAEGRRRASWVVALTVVAGVGAAVVAGHFVWTIVTRDHDILAAGARTAEVQSGISRIEQQLATQQATTWRSANDVLHNCMASNDSATCTVTDILEAPVTTCVRAILSKKDGSGKPLYSLPMCTGRLGGRETRTVSVPWSGGFARDLCSKRSYYGETLDWDQCHFNTEAFEPPGAATERRPSAAPVAKAAAPVP